MKLKREKSGAKGDVIVADGETTETDPDSADILGDPAEPGITETTIKATPALEMSAAGAVTLVSPVSGSVVHSHWSRSNDALL